MTAMTLIPVDRVDPLYRSEEWTCIGCHDPVGWVLDDDPRLPDSEIDWYDCFRLPDGSGFVCDVCAERVNEGGPIRPDIIVRPWHDKFLVIWPSGEKMYGPLDSIDDANALADDLADRFPFGAVIVVER